VQAVEELEGVVNLDPQNATAYAYLARLYQSQGLFDQALASALQAKKLDPTAGSVYNILGTVYFDKGDYEKAVKNYELALSFHKGPGRDGGKPLAYRENSAWVYNNLGLVYIQMKQWDKAQAHLRKALEADPENAVAHNNLGIVLGQKKEYEKALKEFQTALTLDPDHPKAAQNVKDTERILGRLKNPEKRKK
jgi:tetratricopeptide (TPR) repeat protein